VREDCITMLTALLALQTAGGAAQTTLSTGCRSVIPALVASGGAAQPPTPTSERSPESLLKEGYHQENTLREPNLAVGTYRKILALAGAPPEVRSEAHLRLGLCLERMGQSDRAREQFERVIRQFEGQTSTVERARQRLAVISAGDPAMLMPLETGLYVELVRPGTQIERFVASLKDLDEPGLERLLRRFGIDRSLRSVRALLSEAMREDINRFDTVALGFISWTGGPAWTDFNFLLVLHPGKSVAARGWLALMMQSAGEPSGGHGDVRLWAIPDGRGGEFTFANLPNRPGLTGAVLLGRDRQLVCQAIDRWRAGAKARSLSSLPEFRRQAAARRLDSAVLVYADVPQVLARLRRYMAPGDRTRYEASRRLLALDAIERGIARIALLDNGVLVELSLMFNAQASPFYAMLRTPPADRTLFAFVPTDSAAAALMSVGRGRDKWMRIDMFLEQLATIGQSIGGVGALDVREAIRGAEELTGLSVAEDLLGNCRSLAIILPTIRPSSLDVADFPAANTVLALRMHRPAQFLRRLDESLLDRLQGRLETGHVWGVETRTYLDIPVPSGAGITVARVGDVFLVSLSAEMLEQVLRTHQVGDVMDRSSLGRPAAAAVPPAASKVLLFRPELLVNDLRLRDGLAPLDFRPVRPIVVYSLEESHHAAVRVEIGDLTGLLNNMILAAGDATPTSKASTTAISPVALPDPSP